MQQQALSLNIIEKTTLHSRAPAPLPTRKASGATVPASTSQKVASARGRKNGGRKSREGPASLPTKTPQCFRPLRRRGALGWLELPRDRVARKRARSRTEATGWRQGPAEWTARSRNFILQEAGLRRSDKAQLWGAQLVFGAASPAATPSSRTSGGGFGGDRRGQEPLAGPQAARSRHSTRGQPNGTSVARVPWTRDLKGSVEIGAALSGSALPTKTEPWIAMGQQGGPCLFPGRCFVKPAILFYWERGNSS